MAESRLEAFAREVPGARVCVLMVHGIFGSPHHFDMLLPHVPEDWALRSILLDGHGGTLRDFRHTNREKWETQVAREVLLACEKYDRVVIVAHSMGCMLSANAIVGQGLEHKIAGMLFLGAALYPKCDPPIVHTAIRMLYCKPRGESACMAAARMRCGVEVYRAGLWDILASAPRFLDLFAIARYTRKRIAGYDLPMIALQSYKDEVVARRAIVPFEKNPQARSEFLEQSMHFYYASTDEKRICDVFCDMVEGVNKNMQKVQLAD